MRVLFVVFAAFIAVGSAEAATPRPARDQSEYPALTKMLKRLRVKAAEEERATGNGRPATGNDGVQSRAE
jgi:hypothetical protein